MQMSRITPLLGTNSLMTSWCRSKRNEAWLYASYAKLLIIPKKRMLDCSQISLGHRHNSHECFHHACSIRSFNNLRSASCSLHQLSTHETTKFRVLDIRPAQSHAEFRTLAAETSCFEDHSQTKSSNWNSRNDGYRHTGGDANSYARHLKLFSAFITGMGAFYIIYRYVRQNDLVKSEFFPTASCLSKEQSVASPTKSEKVSPLPNKSAVKTTLVPTDQKKIGADKNEHGHISLTAAIEKAQELCRRRKDEVGSPGIVVCVSVDGKQVYAEGFGYADLENRIPMKPCSVLRIASISKAITATIIAKMWEKGQIDLEKTVQHYVPSFPQKEFMGEKVDITIRQLLNHTSGIRHYKSVDDPVTKYDQPIAELTEILKGACVLPFYVLGPNKREKKTLDGKKEGGKLEEKDEKKEVSEMERKEYYLTKYFPTTTESLSMFAGDPLVAKPGTKFIYTTFGYTLLAAVVESILNQSFTDIMMRTLQHMGLKETYLDLNDPIIYNRARYYVKNENGRIVNAPYVDNSYKWAGGGLLSTAEDVVKFGNILLYSAQHRNGDPGLPGFLKSSTVWKFWAPQAKKGASTKYGLGFQLTPSKDHYGMCEHHSFGAGHTGGAVGVSSALFILPRRATTFKMDTAKVHDSKDSTSQGSRNETPKSTATTGKQDSSRQISSPVVTKSTESVSSEKNDVSKQADPKLPQGVVVAVLINMIGVSVSDTAESIGRAFEDVDFSL